MVPNFSHSISLTIMKSQRRGRTASHVRSASLPCESHPLIADLKEKIRDVQSWIAGADASVAMIETGLAQIELLVTAVNDFIKLIDTKIMFQHDASTECLLEIFLCLIDSYGSLLSDIVVLKQHQFEVRSALRRHDSTSLSSSLKSHKRIEKHLNCVTISLHQATKCLSMMNASNAQETEIFVALRDAIGAMLAASTILFNKVVSVASTSATSSVFPTVRSLNKKIPNGEMEMLMHVKFERLEEYVRIIESGCEKVAKSLVNCRVALLNIQSNSF